MSNRNLRRGGYIANYSTNADDTSAYMLYSPPHSDNLAISQMYTPPGITNGGSANIDNSSVELGNGNEFFYSTQGGCAACEGCKTTSGGSKFANRRRGGVGLELAPFISALALLGARLLADEEIGIFNAEEKQMSGGNNSQRRYRRY